MAEGSSASGGSKRGPQKRDGRRPQRKGITGPQAVREAREQLGELIGREVESVVGMDRNEDGWHVTVQVVELERIPNSTDVLGIYEVTLDDGGDVTGYRRTRRYYRSQASDD
jgi:hypothetical protein